MALSTREGAAFEIGCRSANAICSSSDFDIFIDKTSFKRFCRKTHIMTGLSFRDEVPHSLAT
jgi:hypothetical protein